MVCPGPPLCCDLCCTHRLWDDLDWSDSVTNRQICGAGLLACPTVVDSWRNGDYVYLVAELPKNIGGVLRYQYRAEKWSKTGTRAWKTAILFTTTDTGFADQDRSEAAKIASDGTNVWVAIAENAGTGGLSTMWRLNASTGATSFAGTAGCGDSLLSGLKVRSLCPDGAGKVLVGHQGGIGGANFINTWDDDSCSDYFGVPGSADGFFSPVFCTSIVVDGSDVYAGHTSCYCSLFADGLESCGPPGFVSRFNSDRDVVWISYKAAVEKAFIAKVGNTIFYGLNGFYSDSEYGSMDDEWGVPNWERSLDSDPMVDTHCGADITDLDADGSHIWISACRWVFKLDHTGTIESAVPHVHESDIPTFSFESPVKTVASIQDGTAVGGGEAMPCEPDDPLDPEERGSTETECGTLEPGCLGDSAQQISPAWCNVNACGVKATNGRFAIGECEDPAQFPPCTGPGTIKYTDCDDVLQNPSFTFTSECSEGGRTWTGEWDGGSVSLEYICGDTFGPENVTLVIDGCSVTVDTAEIVCDGPLGYAAFYFTFSGDCGECSINGCGVFGADDCEVGVTSPCCTNQLPQTLTASLTSAGCPSANGQTITLNWNGTTWVGTANFGGQDWSVAFNCAGTVGDSCSLLWVIGGSIGCQPSNAFGSSGCSCDPLMVSFTTTIVGSGCPCFGQGITVAITA